MPIKLNTAAVAQPKLQKKYLPSFFNRQDFTGSGGGSGHFHSAYCVRSLNANNGSFPFIPDSWHKTAETVGDVTKSSYPLALIPYEILNMMDELEISDLKSFTCIGTGFKSSGPSGNVYLALWPERVLFVKRKSNISGASVTESYFRWTALVLLEDANKVYSSSEFGLATANSPEKAIDTALGFLSLDGFSEDGTARNSIYNQKVAQVLMRLSELWQTQAAKCICWAIKMLDSSSALKEHFYPRLLSNVENYRVPFDDYKDIYDACDQSLRPDQRYLLNFNLNVLLFETLNTLRQNYNNLYAPPANYSSVPVDPFYTAEQKNVICSMEPLILVQAVAGSGKSTVILGRVEQLIAAGVNPQDILVLSFTNAAADHILDINPNLKSMTIDSMISMIYQENFPVRNNAPINTVINALRAQKSQILIADELSDVLSNVCQNRTGSHSRLNTFVAQYQAEVLDALQKINLICIELKIILCCQNLASLQIPSHIKSCFVIVDEVQDNSIYQFIYVLKQAALLNQSLMMVGDGSQTLFEWRSSNPKALTAMETSGVFSVYPLTTNYRSKQEILDFANVLLDDIEANQYARLQLNSSTLTPVTKTSFAQHVTVVQENYDNVENYLDNYLPHVTRQTLLPWIDEQLKQQKQVCVLAPTHKELNQIMNQFMKQRPGVSCVDISASHQKPFVAFSHFVKKNWNSIRFFPVPDFCGTLLDKIEKSSKFRFARIKADFYMKFSASINQAFNLFHSGYLSLNVFEEKLKNTLIDYEAKYNMKRLGIQANENQKSKQSKPNAPVLFSTIHSAKGMEFDSTAVFIRQKENQTEADKRAYYVALTRAKENEIVFTFSNGKSVSVMMKNYNFIYNSIH